MSITYNLDIPATLNNPSDDQPKMKINTNAINQLIAVDHFSFADGSAGKHQKVTYANVTAPGAPISPASVSYTTVGTAHNTVPQNFFKNADGTFLLSCVRAFGSFSGAAPNGAKALINSHNVLNASKASGVFTITLTANCVTGNNVVVLFYVTGTTFGTSTYTFVNPTLTLTVNDVGAFNVFGNINFVVLQI